MLPVNCKRPPPIHAHASLQRVQHRLGACPRVAVVEAEAHAPRPLGGDRPLELRSLGADAGVRHQHPLAVLRREDHTEVDVVRLDLDGVRQLGTGIDRDLDVLDLACRDARRREAVMGTRLVIIGCGYVCSMYGLGCVSVRLRLRLRVRVRVRVRVQGWGSGYGFRVARAPWSLRNNLRCA